MPDLDALKARIRQHPAFRGGAADETYWLDLLEVCLHEVVPQNLDGIAEHLAAVHERNSERWLTYISASENDLLAWKVLQALLRRLMKREPGSLVICDEQEPIWRAGLNGLNQWAREVAVGDRREPSDHPDRRKHLPRNGMIVAAVNGIREVSGIPYERDDSQSGEPRTACHVVAERLGWTYSKVRTIWRRNRYLIDRQRQSGRMPPARKRTRSR